MLTVLRCCCYSLLSDTSLQLLNYFFCLALALRSDCALLCMLCLLLLPQAAVQDQPAAAGLRL
jgi:hypothetical protein